MSSEIQRKQRSQLITMFIDTLITNQFQGFQHEGALIEVVRDDISSIFIRSPEGVEFTIHVESGITNEAKRLVMNELDAGNFTISDSSRGGSDGSTH